jgi:hypothetical protein
VKTVSGNRVARIKLTGHVAAIKFITNLYSVLVKKPEGKRHTGRPEHRWEDSVEMDLKGIESEVVD